MLFLQPAPPQSSLSFPRVHGSWANPQPPQICTARSASLGNSGGSYSVRRPQATWSQVPCRWAGACPLMHTPCTLVHVCTHTHSHLLSTGFSIWLFHGLAARPVWVWEQVDRASSYSATILDPPCCFLSSLHCLCSWLWTPQGASPWPRKFILLDLQDLTHWHILWEAFIEPLILG